jgi:hypothetical protein
MKHLKKFNESHKYREISNAGFLDSDFLTTMFINNDHGILYIFNWGNYGKVRNYLSSLSINDKDEKIEIEDWITNRLRDEEMDVNINVESIDMLSLQKEMEESIPLMGSKMLDKYSDDSIGDGFIKISFRISN